MKSGRSTVFRRGSFVKGCAKVSKKTGRMSFVKPTVRSGSVAKLPKK